MSRPRERRQARVVVKRCAKCGGMGKSLLTHKDCRHCNGRGELYFGPPRLVAIYRAARLREFNPDYYEDNDE